MLQLTTNINFKAAIAGAAILTILSTLVPNIAEARGSGGRASGGRFNDFSLVYEFALFTLDPSLKLRTPNAGGTFVGAIENFTGGFTDVNDAFLLEDFVIESANSLTLDLTPRFISAGNIKLLNGDNAISSSDKTFLTTSTDRIEYTLTSSDFLNKYNISELTLFIEDTSNFDLLDTPQERNLALTSIDYIVNNKLLELVNGIRVSGAAKADSTIIVSNESTETRNINFTTTVPESSNVLGLLVLGGLGTSLLLRQKPERA